MEITASGAKKRPDIFHYSDIREFLLVHFEYLRTNDDHFSLRRLAEKAGLSMGLLPAVMNHKATLTKKALQAIIPFLDLPATEINFLKWLRTLSESPIQSERVHAYKNIRRHYRYSESKKNEIDSYQYLTKWYYPIVRELTRWPTFQLDARWVKQQLAGKITLSEASEALVFLMRKGYLSADKSGKTKPADETIYCSSGVHRLAMAEYHMQLLDLAKASIFDVERDHRDINAMTISFDIENMPEVKKILAETLEKLGAVADNSKNKDTVMQFSLLAFPVANSPKKKKFSK